MSTLAVVVDKPFPCPACGHHRHRAPCAEAMPLWRWLLTLRWIFDWYARCGCTYWDQRWEWDLRRKHRRALQRMRRRR